MIRKSYIDSQGKIVCPMNGANYLTLRGKLVNWTSEDILKVVQENIDNINIGDKGKEPWEPIEDNEEDKEKVVLKKKFDNRKTVIKEIDTKFLSKGEYRYKCVLIQENGDT